MLQRQDLLKIFLLLQVITGIFQGYFFKKQNIIN